MRKFLVTFMTSLLSCSAAFAFWPEAADSSLELGVGYRWDSFKFKTVADSFDGERSPIQTRSDHHFRDLEIWQIELRGTYVTCDNIYLRGYADYGWVTHGRARVSNHVSCRESGSGSSSENFFPIEAAGIEENGSSFARDRGRIRTGEVYDVSIAAGYQFKLCDDSFAIAPLVGYSWHGQHLRVRHRRDCSEDNNFSNNNDYSGYDDNYGYSDDNGSERERNRRRFRTRWDGVFVGVDFDYKFLCDWTLYCAYEYHWANYHASAGRGFNDNMRTERMGMGDDCHRNFRNNLHQHSRRAYGQIFDVGLNWELCDCWTVGVLGRFQWWDARRGRERGLVGEAEMGHTHLKCHAKAPLRRVRWDSSCVMFDVGLSF